MRYVIAYEGVMTKDGRLIEHGALTWEKLPVPVLWGGSEHAQRIDYTRVGLITAIDRDEDGAVWAEYEGMEIPEGHILSLDGAESEIGYFDEEPKWMFQAMRVAGAHILPREKWAW